MVSILKSTCCAFFAFAIFFSGCASNSGNQGVSGFISPPQNPENVVVKVSLRNRAAYVLEGDRPLMITPVAIGKPGAETPQGRFRVIDKIVEKRSGTYGFHVRGGEIRPGTRGQTPSGWHYVGYPLPYWVEFSPGYGFHAGAVWPTPRTHGCLRVHPRVAPQFFQIVREGTPVLIAPGQPEDATLGRNIARPTDYADPDPPGSWMVSRRAFYALMGPGR
ncbi:MAG: L,D-transpeptidase [Verrucomicrobiae bacterium]|nr:L,D-transpeptidase [Verrucomicrobiae bacterium]